MARFTRFMLGGIFGTALGLLFAPKTGKEMRRMLMGGRRRALPPAAESPRPAPMTAPPENLEERIEKTREQVEAEIEQSIIIMPAALETPETVEEEMVAETETVGEEMTAAAEVTAEVEVEIEVDVELEAEPVAEELEAEPVAEELEAEPVAEELEAEPVAEELEAAAEVAVEEAAAEEAVGEEPSGVEEEAGEETNGFAALKIPVAGEPRVEETEPAVDPGESDTGPAPTQLDRDEMRRRIEETRARLKAKAFDSMVDGETMIAKGEDIKPAEGEPPDPGIDSETEDRIDQMLEEED